MCRLVSALLAVSMAPASALEIRPLPAVCRPVAGEALTWDTRNFRIVSEVGIPDRELLKLAVVADATARAVEHHPIAWFDPPRGERPRLFIQRDAASCEAAGAAPGTAGMYLWRRKAVIVDGARLFPVAAAGNRLKPLPDEEILIHEIVHLCMHGSHDRLPQWFAEGVCEYFAAAHQGGGVFRFDSMDRDIRQHLRRRFGKASEAIPAMPVASIADHDADGWLAFMRRQAVEERYSGYVTALLLVHYHLHAGERRREIAGAFATSPPTQPDSFEKLTASGASIQARLIDYWSVKGLKIRFDRDASLHLDPKP